jgi:hypothetical protein
MKLAFLGCVQLAKATIQNEGCQKKAVIEVKKPGFLEKPGF